MSALEGEQNIINPIAPEYIPRLTREFVALYNKTGALRLANHQVPIEESRVHPEKYSLDYASAPAPEVARELDHVVPVPAGGSIMVRVYESAASINDVNRPVYINYHGGGWVFGGLLTNKGFCSRVCNDIGCVVVDVDYRLAPEHPWPAQIQDCWAAFLWVHENAAVLRIDPMNIVVGGSSAGGHLAAIVAQRCLAIRIPLKLQILTVPITDLTALDDNWNLQSDCPYKSYRENANAPCLPLERMQFFFRHFLGEKMPHPLRPANPAILSPEVELSPIKAESVKGLAPALISVAEIDVLRDEGKAYARKLEADGVPVKLRQYMGVPHIFALMDAVLPEAKEYLQDCCNELKKAFGLSSERDRT